VEHFCCVLNLPAKQEFFSFPSPDDDVNFDDAPQDLSTSKSSKSLLHVLCFTSIYILSQLSYQILQEQVSMLVLKLQNFVTVLSKNFLELLSFLL
jgi:hypothetical protein